MTYRNLGIGRILVDKVKEHAKKIGCQKVHLTTWTTMFSAVRLYQKLGFKIVGYILPRETKLFKYIQLNHIYPMIGERIPEMLLEL